MRDLTGNVALVTGAGRGIGAAITELLARQGVCVMMTARTESELEETAARIRTASGSVEYLAGDLTEAAFVQELFADVGRRFGHLDILVNNAGVAPFGPVENLDVRALRSGLELNITAAFACMQQAIRMMKANGGTGKIVNIGSVRSHWTEGGDAGAYNATKAGLRAITETVARQLHGTGLNIAVGLVCPGAVDTLLTNPQREPRPQWMRPETVAEAVLFSVRAPDNVNVFDLTLFTTDQKPF